MSITTHIYNTKFECVCVNKDRRGKINIFRVFMRPYQYEHWSSQKERFT